MSPIKIGCIFCPPHCKHPRPDEDPRESTMHPSWTTGMQALEDYNHWVNAVVLPIAFQWIEEHKPEVYANVPEELRDDVGVAIAAAFNLVKDLPAYQQGRDNCDAAQPGGAVDSSNANPVWTGIAKKARANSLAAFAEQAPVLGDTIP